MKRRSFFGIALIPTAALYAAVSNTARTFIRGKLTQLDGTPPTLKTADGRVLTLSGDEPTKGVLGDPRLKDADFEIGGKLTAPGQFEIDPIHTRSLFAYQNGRRLMVTYWCDICYIRTFTPGVCWCCQEWTKLDLKEPDAPDPKP